MTHKDRNFSSNSRIPKEEWDRIFKLSAGQRLIQSAKQAREMANTINPASRESKRVLEERVRIYKDTLKRLANQ